MTLDTGGNAYVTGDTGLSGGSFVAKLSGTNGSVVWNVSHGYNTGYNGYDYSKVAVDSLGNVYTTGEYDGTVDIDPGSGTHTLTSYGSKKAGYATDVYVLELNANGNFVW